MKLAKRMTSLIFILVLMVSFSQCSTTQKLQNEAPTSFGDVYCQNWTAGVQGGGSGINLFIPIGNTSIRLDSVYFRGKATKLEVKPVNPRLFIGRFKTEINQPKDIILSSDSKEEYNNKLPEQQVEIPFELTNNECVVSYKDGNKTLYYKISNVREEQPIFYPSAPPN
ncbi:hypothetical protein SAMN04515667_0585 [Formosa sp. Hel1_31_208]|uniref:hypothetical protein n=1 Tax=Formosa sp. Hel1_31_208 TaxID=1798225 RepID=UPI00087CAF94|nr:hypothetical protein [Formosa sp. Hel1_31_208]SDR76336.1 hypothetical protein SAMN04515667_0585 [Formosa sp. Hel1_31_208]